MKSIQEIIEQQPVFLHNWSESKMDGIKYDFDIDFEPNILFATYGTDNYAGDAFVIFEKDGLLYEVNGSHCSCYGLENSWDPEILVLEEIENRIVNGHLGEDDWTGNIFKDQLKTFLGL